MRLKRPTVVHTGLEEQQAHGKQSISEIDEERVSRDHDCERRDAREVILRRRSRRCVDAVR
jgi:hypothetical protein